MIRSTVRHRYIDGVGSIRVHDGIVRIDLLAMSPTLRDKDGDVMPELTGQLVMSLNGFARCAKVLGMTLSEMAQKGLIPGENVEQLTSTEELPDPAESEAEEVQANADSNDAYGGSPNFQ